MKCTYRNFFVGTLMASAVLAATAPVVNAYAATPAPASVGAAWKIVGNGYAGDLVLTQSADGRLSGTVYGQPVEGYYAAGVGQVIFTRNQNNKPYQIFIGSASATGLQGEFYALDASGGATPVRIRYDWSATVAPAFVGMAPKKTGVALLPPTPAPAAAAAPAPAQQAAPLARLTGWEIVSSQSLTVHPPNNGTVTALCTDGKVATGFTGVYGGGYAGDDFHTASEPLLDGSGFRFSARARNLNVNVHGSVICISRPDGYQVYSERVVIANRDILAGPSRSTTSLEAVCPAGKVMLGGGTRTDADIYTPASAPRPDGRTWRGLFRNFHLLQSQIATVYVICANERAVPRPSVVSAAPVTLGQHDRIRMGDASCAAGQRGLSAGFWSTSAEVDYFDMYPYSGNRWIGPAVLNRGPTPADVSFLGLCADAS